MHVNFGYPDPDALFLRAFANPAPRTESGYVARRMPPPIEAELTLEAMDELVDFGLFDAHWYRAHYRDVAISGVDPVQHFLAAGAEEQRRPNALFDPRW